MKYGERRNHPWQDIDLRDYENHMCLDDVQQLPKLNEIMKEQFIAYPAKTVMILGVAGGNGLEHIDPHIFDKVYGIDINSDYLAESVKRYPQLLGTYETICCDLSEADVILPEADLLIADLLIEYIGYDCFQNTVKRVKPSYVSCVIQINSDAAFVSASPFRHIFDRLDEIHHSLTEHSLSEGMYAIGYHQRLRSELALPNGKKLVRLDFMRPHKEK